MSLVNLLIPLRAGRRTGARTPARRPPISLGHEYSRGSGQIQLRPKRAAPTCRAADYKFRRAARSPGGLPGAIHHWASVGASWHCVCGRKTLASRRARRPIIDPGATRGARHSSGAPAGRGGATGARRRPAHYRKLISPTTLAVKRNTWNSWPRRASLICLDRNLVRVLRAATGPLVDFVSTFIASRRR